MLLVILASHAFSTGPATPAKAEKSLAKKSLEKLFEEDVWAKVAERTCLKCHQTGGDAAASDLLLSPLSNNFEKAQSDLANNYEALAEIARSQKGDPSRILLKATGGLDHGGGRVVKPDSTAYQILQEFVSRVGTGSKTFDKKALNKPLPPFFEGISLLSPPRLLRRVTLSLAGRLPTDAEIAEAEKGGMASLDFLLTRIMKENAFYERLKEGFNDIFLTIGIEDNAETLLSYEHFEKTRGWPDKYDFSKLPEKDRQKAGWAMFDVYRKALLQEPLELISYIVRNERPFSELATADYIMVSPYTARGYGIFEKIKTEFKNPDDPFEYIPAKLSALKDRSGKVQESPTGLYPHAGLLSMFHYLRRYPTTETNRNRLRARMVYQHFLGVDIMQLAPRVGDAAAISVKYKIPTMQAAECVVCHKTIDPVAGIFQDFNNEGSLGPRKDGWYKDMFASGFEGEDLPKDQRWRSIQWLAQRVVQDPRFPIAMIEHVYFIMFGRKVLQAPEDIDDPMFASHRRAYRAQRQIIQEIAAQFKASQFNLKVAFKAIILNEFYRVDGASVASADPARRAELDDSGVVRLLSPEQLDRKLKAIFGKSWGRLDGDFKILYGGINSLSVTERNGDPSGAMGSIQRLMANDISCANVGRDFHLPAEKRILFAKIEHTVVPGKPENDQKIRAEMVFLCQKLLGRDFAPNHPEIDRMFALFQGILIDSKAQKYVAPRETYFCGGREDFHVDDPNYTIRAWRAVVTYLLRQHDFLYE